MKIRFLFYAAALLVLLILGFTPMHAQGNVQIRPTTVAPTGNCPSPAMDYKMPNGTLYTCQNGTWGIISGGGGGGNCPAAGSAGQIQTYSDLTHCASSPATADSSGNITSPLRIHGGPAVSSYNATVQTLYGNLGYSLMGTIDPSSSTPVALIGLNQDSTTNPFTYGLVGAAVSRDNTGAKTAIIGADGEGFNQVGAIPTVIGISGVAKSEGGVATSGIAHYADNCQPAGTGTFTNCFGLYIVNQTGGGTANFNLYSPGAAPSLFGGPISAASLSTGTSPPTCTPGTAGCLAMKEGTAPSVCAVAGVDCFYADSTAHSILLSVNNGSYLPVVQGPASSTNGHCAEFSGTSGGLLADSGSACGGGSTPGTGGAWWLWGPSPSTTGVLITQNPGGPGATANAGNWFPFIATTRVVAGVTYYLEVAGASGTGLLAGIFAVSSGLPSGTALCFGVATGTAVTGSGAQKLSFTSSCSSLVIGQPYVLVLSSDDTSIQISGVYSGLSSRTAMMNANYAHAQDGSLAVSSGSGGSLTFTAVAGWTLYGGPVATSWPLMGAWN